jgi:hypothetical protein
MGIPTDTECNLIWVAEMKLHLVQEEEWIILSNKLLHISFGIVDSYYAVKII